MPYWEVLGRTAVTQGTQETADRITQFLTYSGVDAAISFDEERSVYIVSVPQAQANLAEKLIKNDINDQMDDISNNYVIEEISSSNNNILTSFVVDAGLNKITSQSSNKVTVTLTKSD